MEVSTSSGETYSPYSQRFYLLMQDLKLNTQKQGEN